MKIIICVSSVKSSPEEDLLNFAVQINEESTWLESLHYGMP